jgi:3-hydroxybutyryl-CoA dehydrogenase
MEIKKLGVVGAGAMGNGIAQLAAQIGCDVVMRDIEDAFVERGMKNIDRFLSRSVEKGKLESKEKDAISSMSLTEIAAATKRPENVCGMHFFNPVPLMRLVEVIRGYATSDETVAITTDLAKKMGKTTVEVKKDSPGLGPFELMDLTGIDICYFVNEYFHKELNKELKWVSPNLFKTMIRANKLGRKTGEGWYDYSKLKIEYLWKSLRSVIFLIGLLKIERIS